MTRRNLIALSLSVLALVLLWPGLVKPALTITASIEVFGISREVANETRSVLGAVRSLHDSGNDFVAGLILLFSVLVPLTKAVLVIPVVLSRNAATAGRVHRFVQVISKWSMADVFAVGMLIALLVAKGTANLSAVAGAGFYFFTAYCLVSNLAFQVLEVPRRGPITSSTA